MHTPQNNSTIEVLAISSLIILTACPSGIYRLSEALESDFRDSSGRCIFFHLMPSNLKKGFSNCLSLSKIG
jgi:hypothetical protein